MRVVEESVKCRDKTGRQDVFAEDVAWEDELAVRLFGCTASLYADIT